MHSLSAYVIEFDDLLYLILGLMLHYRFKQNVHNSRVYTTKQLTAAINKSVEKPKVFVLVTGVGAYEPSDTEVYDESSPTTGRDFFSRLTVEWEKAANVEEPCRLVSVQYFKPT